MTMITPSYLGETIEYSSLHACRSTLEDPTFGNCAAQPPPRPRVGPPALLCEPLHVRLRKGVVPDFLRASVYFAVSFLLILRFGDNLRVQHIRLF